MLRHFKIIFPEHTKLTLNYQMFMSMEYFRYNHIYSMDVTEALYWATECEAEEACCN